MKMNSLLTLPQGQRVHSNCYGGKETGHGTQNKSQCFKFPIRMGNCAIFNSKGRILNKLLSFIYIDTF